MVIVEAADNLLLQFLHSLSTRNVDRHRLLEAEEAVVGDSADLYFLHVSLVTALRIFFVTSLDSNADNRRASRLDLVSLEEIHSNVLGQSNVVLSLDHVRLKVYIHPL